MVTQDQTNNFHQYASNQLASGAAARSIDELFDKWRHENLDADEVAENVAAVQGAIDDMNGGDQGHDATAIVNDVRGDLRLPAAE